jgi:hypothetical protein
MKSLPTIVVGSAATALMWSGFAFAQQQSQQQEQSQQHQQQQYQQGEAQHHQQGQPQQLDEREVRQFLGMIERDVNQMVQTRNLSHLREWTEANIADNAVFSRTNAIETDGQSRFISSVTITKPDLLRLQRFVLSSMSERLNAVEDFRLDMHVLDIQPVGDAAAMVKSRVAERATLMPPQAESGGRAGEQGEFTTGQGGRRAHPGEEFEDEQSGGPSPRSEQGGLQLESQATCTHLIERNRDSGRLQIAMGICEANTNAEL